MFGRFDLFIPLVCALLWIYTAGLTPSTGTADYVGNENSTLHLRAIKETKQDSVDKLVKVDKNGSMWFEIKRPTVDGQAAAQRTGDQEGENNDEDCPSGHIYDDKLLKCRPTCDNEHTYYDKLNACVPNVRYPVISKRPLCKNISILFQDINRKKLTEILEKYHNSTSGIGPYTNNTEGITICYPFSLKFMLCERLRRLHPHEYKLVDSGLRISRLESKNEYDLGDFHVTDAKKAIVCRRKSHLRAPKTDPFIFTVLSVGWCTSSISLFFTIVLFVLANEWKYHTKVLLCHILSLFVFYTLLFLRLQFNVYGGTNVCAVIGITLLFSFLSAFFWLNVLAYEIWKKLGTLQANPLSPPSHLVKFFVASLYGWGLPLAITGSALSVNYGTPHRSLFNPQFRRRCWLSEDTHATLAFMYVPAAAILAANTVFFFLTVFRLKSIGRDATAVNTSVHKQLFKTYLKLMILMGVCWIMEVISAFVGKSDWYWFGTDVVNSLQGFFIFLIYLFKQDVVLAIRRTIEHNSSTCNCFSMAAVAILKLVDFCKKQPNEGSVSPDNKCSAQPCEDEGGSSGCKSKSSIDEKLSIRSIQRSSVSSLSTSYSVDSNDSI